MSLMEEQREIFEKLCEEHHGFLEIVLLAAQRAKQRQEQREKAL